MVRTFHPSRFTASKKDLDLHDNDSDNDDRRPVSPKRPSSNIRFAALLSAAFASVIAFALASGLLHTSSLRAPSKYAPSLLGPAADKRVIAAPAAPAPPIAPAAHAATVPAPVAATVADQKAPPIVIAAAPPPPPPPRDSARVSERAALPAQPHQCHILDVTNVPTDQMYSFNARTLCMTSTICLRAAADGAPATIYTAADPQDTICHNQTAAFQPHQQKTPSNCTTVQNLVHCAHGRYKPPRTPVCPRMRRLAELPRDELDAAVWSDPLTLVMPAYPHMGNIFHFSFVAGSIAHIASALPVLRERYLGRTGSGAPAKMNVTLLFRGEMPHVYGGWQKEVLDMIVNYRLKRAGISVSFATLNESVGGDSLQRIQRSTSQLFCSKSAVLIGLRSHVNLWPFPSSRGVSTKGDSVPIESIAFRHASYRAFGIPLRVPDSPRGAMQPPPREGLIDFPPLAVGYARRNIRRDPTPENPYQEGTTRRFSDADEVWFMSMLKEEAAAHGMAYVTLQSSGGMPLSEQARNFASVGVIAGIHGANLMNAIFMAPFSSMYEIFPAMGLACYVAGANSGLAYSYYKPIQHASGEQSGCAPDHRTCWRLAQSRRVMIAEEGDHAQLRRLLLEGIARVKKLRSSFAHLGAVPVLYDDNLSHYRIDWGKSV